MSNATFLLSLDRARLLGGISVLLESFEFLIFTTETWSTIAK